MDSRFALKAVAALPAGEHQLSLSTGYAQQRVAGGAAEKLVVLPLLPAVFQRPEPAADGLALGVIPSVLLLTLVEVPREGAEKAVYERGPLGQIEQHGQDRHPGKQHPQHDARDRGNEQKLVERVVSVAAVHELREPLSEIHGITFIPKNDVS